MHYFRQRKNLLELNITHDNNRIKLFHIVQNLGCYLDVNLSGESMTMKSLKKIMQSCNFLIGKMSFSIQNYA